MKPEKDHHQMIHELLLENQRLITENNQLLKKMNRRSIWSFWLKVVWFAVLIGLPFLLYYYIVEPYFTSLGSSFETFQQGLQEIPGWKQFYEAAGGNTRGGE
ncbi:MAG: hypothetical protein KC877_02225 [Candidatus Kaiserbacteria bacterium]|nr:hypothetical protein [Candidatus Kaiserbacteria bacterium]MCB9816764.1 hypothetical protein [Candidatus Nomurabacteria bacterium]